jgi:hypothetical protein
MRFLRWAIACLLVLVGSGCRGSEGGGFGHERVGGANFGDGFESDAKVNDWGTSGELDIGFVSDRSSAAQEDIASDIGAEDAYGVPTKPALAIFKVTPVSGNASELTTVSIEGDGFDDTVEVFFGETKAPFVFVLSEKLLTCSAPPHPAGSVDVKVVRGDGESAVLEGGFQYVSTLSLLSIEPSQGSARGGTPVTIKGTGFLRNPLFLLGGRLTIDTKIVSDNEALAITPPNTPGKKSLIAVAEDERAKIEDAFEYLEVPPTPHPQDLSIISISPKSGPVWGGTTVTIVGTGFGEGVWVRIGALPATDVKVLSQSMIRAKTPKGSPGTADVIVGLGQWEVVLKDGFTYDLGRLALFAIEPDIGSWAGGTKVKLYGFGLDSVHYVVVGGGVAKDLTLISPTELAITVPRSEVLGVVPVVAFGDGIAMLEKGYFYFDPTLRGGGTWGGPIKGALNVTVLDGHNSRPLKDAYVIWGADPHSKYQGFTDDRGQITFSDFGLRGRATISTTKQGYTAYTVADFDAQNVTVYISPLNVPEQPTQPPTSGSNQCTVRGKVRDFGKYFLKPSWAEGDVLVSCSTTASSMWGGGVDPGPKARCDNRGRFEIQTMTGTFRVICQLIVVDPRWSRGVPLRMGISDPISCTGQEGPIEGVELSLDVPLDDELWVGFGDLPLNLGLLYGPGVVGALRLASSEYLDILKTSKSWGDRIEFISQPKDMDLWDGYWLYASVSSKAGGGLPYSVVLQTGKRLQDGGDLVLLTSSDVRTTRTSITRAITAICPTDGNSAILFDSLGRTYLFEDGEVFPWRYDLHFPIYGAFALDKDNFIAAGAGGRIFKVEDGKVEKLFAPVNQDLIGFWASGLDDYLVAGGPFVMRPNGGGLDLRVIPEIQSIRGVYKALDGQIYVCGQGGKVAVGDFDKGFTVATVADANKDLYRVTQVGADIWIFGQEGIMVKISGEAQEVFSAPTKNGLRGGVLSDDGGMIVFGDNGTLLKFDGMSFEDLSNPALDMDLLDAAKIGDAIVLVGRRFLRLPTFVGFPTILEPEKDTVWGRTRLAWVIDGNQDVTHQQVIMSLTSGYPFWSAMASGVVRELDLPDFFGILGYTPVPDDGGTINITCIKTPGFNIDAYTSTDMNYYRRESFSVGVSSFR